MKFVFIVIFSLLLISTNVFSQDETSKIRDLFKTLQVTALAKQMVNTAIPQLKKMCHDVPDEYWDKLQNEIDFNEFIEMEIPLYEKYYTEEDIDKMIEFYSTPLGKKIVSSTSELTAESMRLGQEWGKRIVNDLFNKLKDNGYINS